MNKRFLSALAIGALALSFGACNKSSSANGSTTEGNWIKKAPLGGPVRGYAASFVIDSVAYVGTGQSGNINNANFRRLTDFWSFRAGANNGFGAWTQEGSLDKTNGRYYAVGFSIGQTGYVGGGYDDSTASNRNDFYSYNATTKTWTPIASFPGIARQQAVAFTINNKAYVGTGRDINANPLGDFYQYDPSSASWTSAPSYPGDKRYGAVAFVSNNIGYVTTGYGGSGGTTNDFFAFDGTNWSQKANIANTSSETFDDNYSNIVRYNAVAFVIGGWAYLTTGNNNNTWAYNISTDRWEVRTPYQKSTRAGAVAFTLGNYGYVGTGSASGTMTDNFSQFDPTQTYDENSDK
ncbi:MAG: galactose oxidase [Pseudopedobacter saltans]|uniref:Galactose oxidase n=1 Tax=Pseudopedobacter saltans TaxID=151895 RepID=A0A2W5H2P3_9SPHI|nr:MAG: galactose oxidase [Pseudopedobacter saltans]